jgi:hypothetical protein
MGARFVILESCVFFLIYEGKGYYKKQFYLGIAQNVADITLISALTRLKNSKNKNIIPSHA